jgi:hypothetical protein
MGLWQLLKIGKRPGFGHAAKKTPFKCDYQSDLPAADILAKLDNFDKFHPAAILPHRLTAVPYKR